MPEPHQWSYAFPPPWHPLHAELLAFLGQEAFRPDWCTDDDQKVFAEAARYPDIATFYRESQILCYQGLAYHLHGWKRRYHAVVLQLGLGPLRILDYGCGVGQDGLMFLDYGYQVAFADYPGWPLTFCRWRLQQRGHDASVWTLGEAAIPTDFHIVWCFDVVEHLPSDEQPGLLTHLGTLGNVVLVNLIHDTQADGRIHYPVDRDALCGHVAQSWQETHADIHTSDNGSVTRLVLYGNGVQVTAEGTILIDAAGTNMHAGEAQHGS